MLCYAMLCYVKCVSSAIFQDKNTDHGDRGVKTKRIW